MVGGWRCCWCFRNIVLPLSETSIFASENGHIPIKETCHRLPTIHPFSWGRVFISGRALDMVNTHPNGKFEKSSAAKDVHRPTLKGGVWGDSFPGFPKKKSWCFPINFGKSHFAVRTKLSFHQILDDDSLFFFEDWWKNVGATSWCFNNIVPSTELPWKNGESLDCNVGGILRFLVLISLGDFELIHPAENLHA